MRDPYQEGHEKVEQSEDLDLGSHSLCDLG